MKDPKSLILHTALLVLALVGLALLAVDLHDYVRATGYAQCRAEVAPELKRLAEIEVALDDLDEKAIRYVIWGDAE